MLLHIKRFFHTVFKAAHSLSIRDITKKNLPFSIGWVCIFIWLYAYFLPMGGFKFEKELYNQNVGNSEIYYYVWLFTCCAISAFFDGKKFVPKTFYSVIIALVSFILLQFTGISILSRVIMFIASACIGHIFASSIYGFFMVLNNAEKFHSMIVAVFLPKLMMLVKTTLNQYDAGIDVASVIILVVMLVLAVCSYFYKYSTDEMPGSTKIKAPKKAYALMPIVFIGLAIND
ncbi:MAG: hypothetical protein Q8903_15110, partial [Bacteroidota bacterium]|nr:hypothetical protein [Bacteroidota bacterium]